MMLIKIDGIKTEVSEGVTVAAALLSHGVAAFRTSVCGEERGPLCGMGICFECRVTVDGVPHQRSCMIVARGGMEIVTG
jgi:predicted molibdopterin-dependent oxidoreductase YjgC